MIKEVNAFYIENDSFDNYGQVLKTDLGDQEKYRTSYFVTIKVNAFC